MRAGVLYASLAYVIWGLFPLYFKQLAAVPALEVVLHRSVWSLAFLLVVLALLHRWAWLRETAGRPRLVAAFALSALLLSVNWLAYVWAVQHDRIVDASLGYFITPLVNVILGRVALHERLRPVQWVALGFAAAGVAWLAVGAGQPPWTGLVIGVSFGLYGLMRKTAPLGALEGLTLETLLLAPVAAALLAWGIWQGTSVVATSGAATAGWLLLAGPLTALPLLLFAAGARRISLTTLGMLQYIGPTIQLGLGVWLYREPFGGSRLMGFALVWTALAVYSADGWLRLSRRTAPA